MADGSGKDGVGLSVGDRSALQRGSALIGKYAGMLFAFGTHGRPPQWHDSAHGRKIKAEFNEARALQRAVAKLAAKRAVAVESGMAALGQDGDI